jgi:hypothetical protein
MFDNKVGDLNYRCRENCGERLDLKNSLMIDSQCIDYCWDRFGGVTYMWRLYQWVVNDTTNITTPVEVLNLPSMTLKNIGKCILYSTAFALQIILNALFHASVLFS